MKKGYIKLPCQFCSEIVERTIRLKDTPVTCFRCKVQRRRVAANKKIKNGTN